MSAITITQDFPQTDHHPAWFTHLVTPIRACLHRQLDVMHEQVSREFHYRIVYLHDDRLIRQATIQMQPGTSNVMITRSGEKWPSLVLQVGLAERLLLHLGETPECVQIILSHLLVDRLH